MKVCSKFYLPIEHNNINIEMSLTVRKVILICFYKLFYFILLIYLFSFPNFFYYFTIFLNIFIIYLFFSMSSLRFRRFFCLGNKIKDFSLLWKTNLFWLWKYFFLFPQVKNNLYFCFRK